MKTILVPTDFSKISRNAIDYAAEMAKLTKSKLVLFHVYDIPVVTAEAPIVMPGWEDIEKDCMNGLKKMERSIWRKYGKGVETECICQLGFSVSEIIKQYTDENNIDLVVMGMQGAGYISEKLMGSNATSLIKRANCPVLVINEHVKFTSLKKIVLACDYEKVPVKSILEPLKEFVKLFKSQVYVLNVIKEIKKSVAVKKSAAGAAIEDSLEGIKHSFHFVENDDTIEGINEFVSDKKADMVVIIPRKHKFLDNIFHERNTKRMAFHTSIPLLALHE